MKFKYAILALAIFASSQAAFASVDPTTACTIQTNCTQLTQIAAGMPVKLASGPGTAEAWQIQCDKDKQATNTLMRLPAKSGRGDEYSFFKGYDAITQAIYPDPTAAITAYCNDINPETKAPNRMGSYNR